MKVLIISEETLDKEFNNLLQSLKIEDLESKVKVSDSINCVLYHKFLYELHQFKDALLKSKL